MPRSSLKYSPNQATKSEDGFWTLPEGYTIAQKNMFPDDEAWKEWRAQIQHRIWRRWKDRKIQEKNEIKVDNKIEN